MRHGMLLCIAVCHFLVVSAAGSEKMSRTVVINREWLDERGGAPYILNQPNTTYALATDVRVEGTAFFVDAPNVTLDLQRHTVVYGDGKPIVVANGGFEEGSRRSVPGWDLSQAPAAELAENTSYLFGKQVLRLKSFRVTQRIVSDPIEVPATDHTYVACITPAGGDYRTSLTITVVEERTGKVLGIGKSVNVERGVSAIARFQPGSSRAVRLRIEATPGANRTENLDLDYAMVAVSHDYGILATNAWTGDILGWSNLPRRVPRTGKRVSGFTLKNGSILQGGARGYGSSPLFFAHARDIAVEGVQTLTRGMDTNTLNAESASGSVMVRDSTFRHEVDNISNRGLQYATIRLVHVDGSVRIEGNRFLDVPLVGVLLDEGRQTRILRNEFHQRAVVVNGYGILVSSSHDFEIAENRILAENGRGILLDGYRKEPLRDGDIHDNYVEARERFNREYHTRIEARALRMRAGDAGSHENLNIHHNTFVAETGPGLAQRAYAVRIGYVNKGGLMDHANLRVEHNTMRAITTTSDPNSRASALALDGLAPGVELSIRENILESNDASVTLADTEGPAEGARLIGNTFRKSKKGADRPYVAVHAGYWTFPIHDVEILGPRLENGATLAVRWAGSGAKELSIGYLLTVTACREGKPVPDAEVSLRDKKGKVVFSGKTDAQGRIRDIPAIDLQYRQESKDPNRITARRHDPFDLRVTSGGATVSRQIAPGANREVTIDIASNGR